MTGGRLIQGIVAAVIALTASAGSARCDTQSEVKALFGKFIAAQNAHDLNSVGEILSDTPEFFWVTRNTAIWGRDAALKRFEQYYQGTWKLEPQFDDMRITELSPDVARLFVPAVFTIGPPGEAAQPRKFLLAQVFVRTVGGWRLSTILPFPVP